MHKVACCSQATAKPVPKQLSDLGWSLQRSSSEDLVVQVAAPRFHQPHLSCLAALELLFGPFRHHGVDR